MAIFKKSFELKLIYVYRINDEVHETWLINQIMAFNLKRQ